MPSNPEALVLVLVLFLKQKLHRCKIRCFKIRVSRSETSRIRVSENQVLGDGKDPIFITPFWFLAQKVKETGKTRRIEADYLECTYQREEESIGEREELGFALALLILWKLKARVSFSTLLFDWKSPKSGAGFSHRGLTAKCLGGDVIVAVAVICAWTRPLRQVTALNVE